jgi:hypothetical protein
MTIISVGEEPGGETAVNDKGVRSYQRMFTVVTNSKYDRAYHVGSDARLPRIGSLHPDDPFAWCTRLNVSCPNPYSKWQVSADYSSERELNEDPTAEPAYIRWDSEQFQRPAIQDKNGDAICNSAGDPFDPYKMMDDSRRSVSVQKNLSVVPSWILDYQDAVNSDMFNLDGISIAVGKAKIQRVSVGGKERRNGIAFREVTMQIHLQRDGWAIYAEDVGFRYKFSGVRYNIRNAGDTEYPAAPVPLDGFGAPLDNPSTTANVLLPFYVYSELPFAALPLT